MDTLLNFPCDFLIKVFGQATEHFEQTVLQIIRQFSVNLRENAIQQRNSKGGKYLALSILIPVESQAQLDDIYRALSSNPAIVMVL